MDVEYEDPDLSIQPDLGGERPVDTAIADFSFDPQSLDSLFTEITPVSARPAAVARPDTDASPFAMATDYLSKGLYDRASAEISRAMARGNARADGLALLGDVFTKQGLFGEALERYRDALRLEPTLRPARHRRGVVARAWAGARSAPRSRKRLLATSRPDG